MSTPSEWYKTGEVRIVPWYFGLMRAEFMERRDFSVGQKGTEDYEVVSYQLRAVGTGRLPQHYEAMTGFWSMMSSTSYTRHGDASIWRNLVRFFRSPTGYRANQ